MTVKAFRRAFMKSPLVAAPPSEPAEGFGRHGAQRLAGFVTGQARATIRVSEARAEVSLVISGSLGAPASRR